MVEFKIKKKPLLAHFYNICKQIDVYSIKIIFNIEGWWWISSKELQVDLCDISISDFEPFHDYYIDFIDYRNKKEFVNYLNKIEKEINNSGIFK